MYFRLLFTAIVYHIMNIYTAERRVEVKLPKIWTYMKSRDGKNQRREEKRRRRNIKEEKVRRRKIQVRNKVGKSRDAVFSNALWLWRVEKEAP